MKKQMKITYAILSEKGGRETNEDYVGVREKGDSCCFALADGLGGHGYGEIASKLAVECVLDSFDMAAGPVSPTDFLRDSFEKGQQVLLEKQREMKLFDGMRTTLVVCVVSGNKARWGHIGDSRLYRFRHGRIAERTTDHSVPQMLALSGEIKDKEIRFHPDRNRLLSVLGTEWGSRKYEVNKKDVELKKEKFLLCSDGFWELITEKEMARCLRAARNADEWAKAMEDIVIRNGKDREADNYSAICIWCE